MKRILINRERCDGCKNCQVACMAEHTESKSILNLNLADPANQARNFIEMGPDGKAVPVFCRHCDEPACVTACMSGAMTKNPDTGVVSNDSAVCAGCWMCVMSCPFSMIRSDYHGKTAVKCDFCAERPFPRCVESCPTGALALFEVSAEGIINEISWEETVSATVKGVER